VVDLRPLYEPPYICAAGGSRAYPRRMDIERAIRTRRTHKAFGPEPVDPKTLEELFELARWAPNHHATNPWRFRVLGPEALARLKHVLGLIHLGPPRQQSAVPERADPGAYVTYLD